MAHELRYYQRNFVTQALDAWRSGARNVLGVMPTGAGKTTTFAHLVANWPGASVVIAHRAELVSQMSLALAREGVRHRIIGPPSLGRACASLHMAELGRPYFDPQARCAAAGVDTLIRMDASDPWFQQIAFWVQDEAHHVLASNKWGRACAMMPNAFGLGVTATPVRADGKGLGRHADGLMDVMIEGPTMRDLIEQGFLTDYRVFAPPSDIDLSSVSVGESGDFNPQKLKAARRQSHITGDVVAHYCRIAKGKLGVTFDVDIESATETAAAYRAAGVPAEVVTSNTSIEGRAMILRKFRQRDILQLVNVDLFGEGFDLPAIEVVSFARPTESYSLYCQQFGRALRPMEGKGRAIIIDHVGNVARHGLPDAKREWSLDRRDRSSRARPLDAVPLRTCLNETCLAVYERALLSCPYCGHTNPPAGRSTPEQVDGDLCELDPTVLAALRGEINRIDGDVRYPAGLSHEAYGGIRRNHHARQQAQHSLREAIAWWGGWQEHKGRALREAQKRFYLVFGVDVATAQTLGAQDAKALEDRVRADLARNGVMAAVPNA